MNELVKVFAVGSRVTFAGGLPGTVHTVIIGAGAQVCYRVVWWEGSSRHEGLVEAGEVYLATGGESWVLSSPET